MKLHHRLLALAGSVALAALLFAPQAMARPGSAADAVCEAVPSDAPDDVANAYAGRDTSELDEKACARLCQAVRKACESRAKNIAGCHTDQNKREPKVEGAFCEDKECEKAAKDTAKANDKAAKDMAKETKGVCKDLESDCNDTCEAGTLFPLD